MTDEEILRNAGWSPNSLRLAMGDFDSTDSTKDTNNSILDIFPTSSRQDLKRSTNAFVSTPTSSSLRGSKLVDYKATPKFAERNHTIIDLSVSTVKKQGGTLKSMIHRDKRNGDDGDNDNDILVLAQRFRRQSIDVDKTRSNKNLFDQNATTDENSFPADLNCVRESEQNTSNRVCRQFNFDVVSPTRNPDKKVQQKTKEETFSSNRTVAIDPTPIISVVKANQDVGQSTHTTQMSKFIAAADLDNILPNGWKLFQHQKDAVTECLKLGRSIMAFDMGLGKTLISLIWAKAVCTICPDCIAIIIVPCTLTEIWKREAEMIGFRTVDIRNKNTKLKQNKEGIQSHLGGPWISIHSWSKIPTAADINQKYVFSPSIGFFPPGRDLLENIFKRSWPQSCTDFVHPIR